MTKVEMLAEAKHLLREKLRAHQDQGVRLMAEVAEPADDHPAVLRIVAALEARALTISDEEKTR